MSGSQEYQFGTAGEWHIAVPDNAGVPTPPTAEGKLAASNAEARSLSERISQQLGGSAAGASDTFAYPTDRSDSTNPTDTAPPGAAAPAKPWTAVWGAEAPAPAQAYAAANQPAPPGARAADPTDFEDFLSYTNDDRTNSLVVDGGAMSYNNQGRSLTFSGQNTGANTFAPVIIDGLGGATSVVKTGAGSLVLSNTANDTFTGGITVVSGGTVQLHALNGNQTLGDGGGSTGSLTVLGGGTTVLGGANTYTGGTTLSNSILNMNDAGAGAVTNAATISSGLKNLGGTIVNHGALAATGSVFPNGGVNMNRNLSDAISNVAPSQTGQIVIPGTPAVPGRSQTIIPTTLTAPVLPGQANLALNGASSDLVATGAATVAGGDLNLGTAQTVGAVTLTSGSISGATLTGSSYVLASGSISAALAGAGSLTMSSSTATFAGTNTAFRGITTVTAGTLAISGGSALMNNSAVTGTGTLGVLDSESIRSLAGDGTVTIANTYGLTTGAAGTIFSGGIGGSGSLTKAGSFSRTLTGANTYTGGTTVNAGSLTVAGGTFDLGRTTQSASSLTVNGGTLSIRADSGLGAVPNQAGSITLNGGTLAASGNFTLNASRGITLGATGGTIDVAKGSILSHNGVISGGGSMTRTLSGLNTFTGGTTASSGMLTIGGGIVNLGGTTQTVSGLTLTGGGTDSSTGLRVGMAVRGGSAGHSTFGGSLTDTGSLDVAGNIQGDGEYKAAPLVNLGISVPPGSSTAANKTGRMGYAVLDEGVKAKVNVRQPAPGDQPNLVTTGSVLGSLNSAANDRQNLDPAMVQFDTNNKPVEGSVNLFDVPAPAAAASASALADQKQVAQLMAKARSQYLGGNLAGAADTFKDVVSLDPRSPEAIYFLGKISDQIDQTAVNAREESSKRLMQPVDGAFTPPSVVNAPAAAPAPPPPSNTALEYFPITKTTLSRMTGAVGNADGDEATLQKFFQSAGVDFSGVNGSALAYNGSTLVINQTPDNIARIRNILDRYNDIKQVSVATDFIGVQEDKLGEAGVNWNVARKTESAAAVPKVAPQFSKKTYSLSNANAAQLTAIVSSLVQGPLQPMMGAGPITFAADSRNHQLIAIASDAAQPLVEQLVQALDQPGAAGTDLAATAMNSATVSAVVKELKGVIASQQADSKAKANAQAQAAKVAAAAAERAKTLAVISDAEIKTTDETYSTFSLHVSDVSFKLAVAALARGEKPDPASVRAEEFYNAFDYGDPSPVNGEPVACRIEQSAHPVLQQRNLVRIALRVPATGRDAAQSLRLTVLLDTSGSMERADRAACVHAALASLASLLGPNDVVTLIGFARTPRLLAQQLPGSQAAKLLALTANLPFEGGTNLEEALKLAGEEARRQQVAGAQNRIVLLTDGAANLGDADPEQLAKQIVALRQQGITLDACGVVASGLDDGILEALTRKGDGRYYLLNAPEDADAGFARQLAGAFHPAAENVKVQVHFNPARVASYRLIGFEANRLKTEDFHNDAVTAAQLASEEAAVALYQVEVLPEGDGEIGDVSVRFRETASGSMIERTWTILDDPAAKAFDQASPTMQLAGTAAMLAEKLHGGAVASLFRLETLAPTVNALRGQYANEPRVQDLATMFGEMRRMFGE
jgi:autotransporter-associated beta strand protein